MAYIHYFIEDCDRDESSEERKESGALDNKVGPAVLLLPDLQVEVAVPE